VASASVAAGGGGVERLRGGIGGGAAILADGLDKAVQAAGACETHLLLVRCVSLPLLALCVNQSRTAAASQQQQQRRAQWAEACAQPCSQHKGTKIHYDRRTTRRRAVHALATDVC
jgi:hypothetical protein